MKKIDLIKFKMATFSAIIHFHMADIWYTMLDGQTITLLL